MKHNHIELRSIDTPRKGWEDQFKQMHQNGGDRLMIDDVFVDEDLEEWD
ncbi:MAG: hypothetical protein KAR19_10880 [Bacteroidales bacterium]|nr:hypothetical protein [Bacteroidales bacterium]